MKNLVREACDFCDVFIRGYYTSIEKKLYFKNCYKQGNCKVKLLDKLNMKVSIRVYVKWLRNNNKNMRHADLVSKEYLKMHNYIYYVLFGSIHVLKTIKRIYPAQMYNRQKNSRSENVYTYVILLALD